MKSQTASSKKASLLVLALALLLGGALPLWSQETAGTLTGTVKDPSSAVISGATVTITNKATGRAFTTKTGSDGVYIARGLEPGHYSVRFEMTGFSRTEVADVSLLLGQTLKVDATLQVAPVEQAVTVIETAPLIDLSSTTVGHNLTAEVSDRLPKARSFQSLLILSPSVNSGAIEGGFQVNGASGAENQFVIDGVSTNSLLYGHQRQGAVLEFLQEVQVKTAGTAAEYGGALGGVMSAVTKSGGNAFHGDLHYYFQGNGISAGPVKRLLLDPVTEASTSFIQDSKFEDKRQEFGGSLGGYFIKNKLWFFAAGSPQWRRRSNDYVFVDGKGTVKQKRLDQNLFGKISFDPITRIRTNFTWLYTPTMVSGRLPRFNFGKDASTSDLASGLANNGLGYFQAQTSYTGSADITLTNRSILTVRGGRFWDDYQDNGISALSAVQYNTSAFDLPAALLADVPAGLRQATNYTTRPRVQNTFFDIVTRTYIQADYGIFGHLGGDHDVKAGVGTQRNVNSVNSTYPGGGFVEVFWNRAYTSLVPGSPCSVAPGCRGTYGYYQVNDRGTKGSVGGNITNLYIQDKWKIHPRLTLNLGLRSERETVPTARRNLSQYAFRFNFGDKLAPRLGASYDALGNGNLKLSFSWGRFFDWVKYEVSRGTFGADVWTIRYRSLDNPDVSVLSGTNTPGQNLWSNDPNNPVRDRRVPSFGKKVSTCPDRVPLCDKVDPGIKPMSSDLLNLTAEYQWGPQTVLRGSYVHNSLHETIEDLGVLTAGQEVYFFVNPGEGLGKTMTASGATTKTINTPKPDRRYDAMELSLTRRIADRWFFSGSYVLSRLFGNYTGLADSDEIATTATAGGGGGWSTNQQSGGTIGARPGSSDNRAWDLDELMFDSHGHLNVEGRLPTDRPHVLKLYGSYNFKFGSEVGTFFYLASGTPMSTYVNTTNDIPVFVEGRGNLDRTPVLNRTDLLVAHTFNIAEGKKLRVEFNMLNLFNQKTATYRYNYLNFDRRPSSGLDLGRVDLFKGYDYKALLNASTDKAKAFDPQFNKNVMFNDGFAGRFGIKFTF